MLKSIVLNGRNATNSHLAEPDTFAARSSWPHDIGRTGIPFFHSQDASQDLWKESIRWISVDLFQHLQVAVLNKNNALDSRLEWHSLHKELTHMELKRCVRLIRGNGMWIVLKRFTN